MKYSDFLKYEEKKTHGSSDFPFATYKNFIPELITFFPAHWHDEYEIEYCFKGECIYYINFEKYVLREGDILIVPPTLIHSFEQSGDKSFEGISILFNLNMIDNLMDLCSKKYFMPLLSNEIILREYNSVGDLFYEEIRTVIDNTLKCYYDREGCYELELKIQLFKLFKLFFENNLYKNKSDNYSLTKNIDKTKRILIYIEEHYQEKITLEDLARETNQSIYHLAHSFKNCTGQSPLDFIKGYRLRTAAKLLFETNKSVIDIAIETGFNNVSYFNRAFKDKYKVTPTEYRKEAK